MGKIGILNTNAKANTESVHCRNRLELIESRTFQGENDHLVDLFIEDDVVSIPSSEFQGLDYIEAVHLPSSLKTLGDLAFANITKLREINIPTNVTYIGDNNPLGGCFNVENIIVESPHFLLYQGFLCDINKTTIFSATHELFEQEHIVIPDGIVKLSSNLFWGYEKMKKISMPTSVQEIGSHCFENCFSLEAIEIPERVYCLQSETFRHCNSLKSVKFHYRCKSIGSNCFRNCFSLCEIEDSNVIEEIGDKAFVNCYELIYIDIRRCKEIALNAFKKDKSLIAILCNTNILGKLSDEYPDIRCLDSVEEYLSTIHPSQEEDDDDELYDCYEYGNDNGYEWTDEDAWDAMTDGMYGDYPGPNWDPELFGY